MELERRANDILRVYNPTDERYVVEYDKRGGVKLFPIEAKSEAVFPRYIAKKYLREMFDKMLNDKAREAILKENKRRVSVGMAEMDKTMKSNEQMMFEEKFYNPPDDEAKRIMALLYVGVENEFGIDRGVPETARKVDDRPIFERAMEEVQEAKDSGKYVDTTNDEKTPQNASSEATDSLKCELCGFTAKNNFGLMAHKRSHRSELEKKEK